MKKVMIPAFAAMFLCMPLLPSVAGAYLVTIENTQYSLPNKTLWGRCPLYADIYVQTFFKQEMVKTLNLYGDNLEKASYDTGALCPVYVVIRPFSSTSAYCKGGNFTVQLGLTPWAVACWNSTVQIYEDENYITRGRKK